VFKRLLAKLGFGPSRLEVQQQWRVTRLDRLETYLNVLMEAHPYLRNHPAIVDLVERRKYCVAELTKRQQYSH
jgi:hypothetical protein